MRYLILMTVFVLGLFPVLDSAYGEEINACVDTNTGMIRLLAPHSNSEECRNSENPVSLSQNGGGNGITALKNTSAPINCPINISPALGVICPEGMLVIGGTCLVEVLSGEPLYSTKIFSIYGAASGVFHQGVTCGLDCFSEEGEVNVQPVAFCIDNPFANGE